MKRARGGWRLTLAIALLSAVPPARAQGTHDLRNEAIRLYNAGLYREALPYLDAVLARRERDLEVRIKRGNCYLRFNRPDLAIADFNWLIRYDPTFAGPYIDRAIANLMLGRIDAAGLDFTRAIQLFAGAAFTFDPFRTAYLDTSWNQVYTPVPANNDPSGRQRAIAHCGLGQVHHQLGRDALALAEYDRSLRLDPSDPNTYAGRGKVLTALGRFAPALADYDQALRLAPNHSRALAGRGELHSQMGDSEQALADFGHALRSDPQFIRAYRLRAALLSRMGRHEEALADLGTVLREDPKDVGALKDRGGILVRMGKPESAIPILDQALALDPRRVGAYLNRGSAYSALGRYELAIRDLETAIALDPGNWGAYTNKGLAQFALGQTEQSLASLKALQLSPSKVSPIGDRGKARRALGDWEGAIADFTSVLALEPRNAEVRLWRGWTRFVADRDGADQDAKAFLDLRRGDDRSAPYAAILGALASRRIGREIEAEVFLDRALANTPPGIWPAPVLRYLRRRSSAEDLLAAATDGATQAEAHAFVGVDRLQAGARDEALTHLRWVRDNASASPVAVDLAREALRRIEGVDPGKTPPPCP